MTITLAPQLENRLRQKAARTGESPDSLAAVLLADALFEETPEEGLRDEYRQLAALELQDVLSEAEAARLHTVTQALDDLEMHSPAAEAMFERLNETGRKLDAILTLLRDLPLAEPAR